jgi:multiple sugar transport system permease protein
MAGKVVVESALRWSAAAGGARSTARRRGRLPLAVMVVLLSVVALLYLFPLYWMFTGSLKLQKGFIHIPPEWFPASPSLGNWTNLFSIKTIRPWRWLENSLVVAISTVLLSVSLSALTGYVFAKKQFIGSRSLFFLILATMMLPSQVTMIPLYLMVRKVHLYNTYAGMIIPMIASPFGVFLMRQFMQSIPNELIDAAKIDGASELGVFLRVVVPLAGPALSALSIFTFFNAWNNFMWQLLMASDNRMMTLPVGVAYLSQVPLGDKVLIDQGLLMAGGTFGAIPMIIFFILFQRYFVKGIMLGAVKA